MKIFAKKISPRKIAQWIAVFIGIVLIMYFGLIVFITYFQDGLVEEKFNHEVSTINNASIKKYSLFEGGLSANIEIPNKGNISIMYGIGGLEYIRHIGKYDTVFICPENKNVAVAFNLGSGSKFRKWFPYQINNMQELINHYDDIVKMLETFPNSPNPNYTVSTSAKPFSLQKVNCSLYVTK